MKRTLKSILALLAFVAILLPATNAVAEPDHCDAFYAGCIEDDPDNPEVQAQCYVGFLACNNLL